HACSQRQGIAREFRTHHGGYHFRYALDGLQDDISDKAIADNDVDGAFADIVAFYVTVEIQAAVAKKLCRLLDDFVALDDLFANVKQTHCGLLAAIHNRRQGGTHDGKLKQML